MKLSPKQMAVSGLLGGLTVVLGLTGLGFIPVPTAAGRATIMHIPVVLAAILEGPLTGALVGLIFGLFSFLQAASPMTADPLVAILPRLLIGPVAWLVFRGTMRGRLQPAAPSLAAAAGTLVNTMGVLGLAVLRGYLPDIRAALVIAATHGIPEVLVAMILAGALFRALKSRKEEEEHDSADRHR